eukprot:2068928-Rhodomonas_salina.1
MVEGHVKPVPQRQIILVQTYSISVLHARSQYCILVQTYSISVLHPGSSGTIILYPGPHFGTTYSIFVPHSV